MGVLPCHAIARPPRSVLFWPTHKPRRPEQVCFSPSTSLDAPNKFVFPHPQASTPRTSLFFTIHKTRRPEQVCYFRCPSLGPPNKLGCHNQLGSATLTNIAAQHRSDR